MVAAITSLSHRYYSSTSAQVYGTFTDTDTDAKVQKSTITDGSSTTPPPTNFEPIFSLTGGWVSGGQNLPEKWKMDSNQSWAVRGGGGHLGSISGVLGPVEGLWRAPKPKSWADFELP